jgi:hypothetical protein
MGETKHRAVGDPAELVGDRGVESGVAVAVDVAPKGPDGINVSFAIGVNQLAAFGKIDDKRIGVRGEPIGLGGEWVPKMGLVPGAEGSGVGHGDGGNSKLFRCERK